MRKYLLFVATLLATVLLFSQCSNKNADDNDGYGKEYPQTNKAIDIIDSCMNFMHTDPTKLHHIIDSVGNAKLMSPERCDYYHAMVLYEGEEKCDSALAICNRLLDKGKFGDDKFLEEELCVLASNITFALCHYLETLEYANRGIAICHGQELMNYDEATLMGRAGRVEQLLGRTEDAKQTFAKANELLKEDKTFGGLIARISLMMKQVSLYSSTKEYDKAIAVCHEVLNLVNSFHRNPSPFKNRPQPMETSGEETRSFADFYESQMYCKIAKNYRLKMEQGKSPDSSALRDSINLYLDKWEQTQSHNTPVNLANTINELYYAGRKSAFDNAKETVADLYKSDSIVVEYVDFLTLLAKEAASRRDFQSSSSYQQRALVISDSIRERETIRMTSEQMSIHMVQQEQLARQEAENKASRYRLINVIVAILVISGFVIYILRRKNKEKEEILQMTQQDLIETQEEVNDILEQMKEIKQDKQKNMQELFERIEQVITDKKLYLDPDFNLTKLSEVLATNRTFVSTCVNTITGKQFRTWLAEYRLNIFLQKQKETPDAPIDVLLTNCGYKDQSTFRRQFKATFGTTPSKYKNRLVPPKVEVENELEAEDNE